MATAHNIRVVKVPLCAYILEGNQPKDVTHLFARSLSGALDEVRKDEPGVLAIVVTAHVCSVAGVELDLRVLLDVVGDSGVLIVDGRQAVGNSDLLSVDAADYYVGCGDKWMLGQEALGF